MERNFELENFLNQDSVNIYLLSETFLSLGEALRQPKSLSFYMPKKLLDVVQRFYYEWGIAQHVVLVRGLTSL
jgi:hypothetical protein